MRVEALGVDRLAGAQDVALRVDHTPPVLSNTFSLPIVSGDGYGFRVTTESDDEGLGCISLGDNDSLRSMAEIVTASETIKRLLKSRAVCQPGLYSRLPIAFAFFSRPQ